MPMELSTEKQFREIEQVSRVCLKRAAECLNLINYSKGLVCRDIDLVRMQLEITLKKLESHAQTELRDVVRNEKLRLENVMEQIKMIVERTTEARQFSEEPGCSEYATEATRELQQLSDTIVRKRIKFNKNAVLSTAFINLSSLGEITIQRVPETKETETTKYKETETTKYKETETAKLENVQCQKSTQDTSENKITLQNSYQVNDKDNEQTLDIIQSNCLNEPTQDSKIQYTHQNDNNASFDASLMETEINSNNPLSILRAIKQGNILRFDNKVSVGALSESNMSKHDKANAKVSTFETEFDNNTTMYNASVNINADSEDDQSDSGIEVNIEPLNGRTNAHVIPRNYNVHHKANLENNSRPAHKVGQVYKKSSSEKPNKTSFYKDDRHDEPSLRAIHISFVKEDDCCLIEEQTEHETCTNKSFTSFDKEPDNKNKITEVNNEFAEVESDDEIITRETVQEDDFENNDAFTDNSSDQETKTNFVEPMEQLESDENHNDDDEEDEDEDEIHSEDGYDNINNTTEDIRHESQVDDLCGTKSRSRRRHRQRQQYITIEDIQEKLGETDRVALANALWFGNDERSRSKESFERKRTRSASPRLSVSARRLLSDNKNNESQASNAAPQQKSNTSHGMHNVNQFKNAHKSEPIEYTMRSECIKRQEPEREANRANLEHNLKMVQEDRSNLMSSTPKVTTEHRDTAQAQCSRHVASQVSETTTNNSSDTQSNRPIPRIRSEPQYINRQITKPRFISQNQSSNNEMVSNSSNMTQKDSEEFKTCPRPIARVSSLRLKRLRNRSITNDTMPTQSNISEPNVIANSLPNKADVSNDIKHSERTRSSHDPVFYRLTDPENVTFEKYSQNCSDTFSSESSVDKLESQKAASTCTGSHDNQGSSNDYRDGRDRHHSRRDDSRNGRDYDGSGCKPQTVSETVDGTERKQNMDSCGFVNSYCTLPRSLRTRRKLHIDEHT